MDPPVCRLCQVKHWSWQGHLWPVEEAPRVSTRPPAKPFPGAKREAKRDAIVTKAASIVTPAVAPVTKAKATGRPRKYATEAERARAYRKRKRAKAGSTPAGKRKAPT